MKKEKIKLEDLKVTSFVTSLKKSELNIVGGNDTDAGPTCPPGTHEQTVITCACGQTNCMQSCPPR